MFLTHWTMQAAADSTTPLNPNNKAQAASAASEAQDASSNPSQTQGAAGGEPVTAEPKKRPNIYDSYVYSIKAYDHLFNKYFQMKPSQSTGVAHFVTTWVPQSTGVALPAPLASDAHFVTTWVPHPAGVALPAPLASDAHYGMRPSIVATMVPPPLAPVTALPYIAEPRTTPMASSVPQWGPYVHQDGRVDPRNTFSHVFNPDWLSLPPPSIVATMVPPPLAPVTADLQYITEPRTTPMASSVPQWGPYFHHDGRVDPRNTSIPPMFDINNVFLP